MHRARQRRRHSIDTPYVLFDAHQCQACWACIDACPEGVIGKVDFFFHKHAKNEHPDACKGCLRCVKACTHEALTSRPRMEKSRLGA